MKLAEKIGGKNGLELEPVDPIRAENVRALVKFFNKLTPALFDIILSRGKDEDVI